MRYVLFIVFAFVMAFSSSAQAQPAPHRETVVTSSCENVVQMYLMRTRNFTLCIDTTDLDSAARWCIGEVVHNWTGHGHHPAPNLPAYPGRLEHLPPHR